ncbi:hypothetical protein D4R51_03220 [bacterium]|nr:MAG: hypothetical protein D4R51_03220 [bacterium]
MRTKFLHWGLLLFVFLIPFGTKKFLFDFPTPFRNYYTSEYTSAFLYGSDILFLVCFSFLFFLKPLSWWGEHFKKFRAPLSSLGVFILISAISVLSADYPLFSIYSFGRLALGILSALMVGAALKSNIIRFREIAVAFSLAAVFQSIVGFLQFMLQKSVGLWFLGETVFVPGTPGIAGISVNGVNFARAYGTMPHANILAGFLVLGLIALFYLFLREERMIFRFLEIAGIFTVLTGLFLTFSRSGWITAAVATVLFALWELFADKERRKKVLHLVSLILVSCLFLFIVLGWAIFARATLSPSEGPVADRWAYNKIGAELILSHSLGVGVGNQLFYTYHSGLFDKYNVNSWGQWQPIHNLYLMVGAETGILGLISFLVFVVLLILRSPGEGGWSKVMSFELKVTLIMLLALLVSGLFDHFLWDLQLGRLMLWVVIGILLGPIKAGDPINRIK